MRACVRACVDHKNKIANILCCEGGGVLLQVSSQSPTQPNFFLGGLTVGKHAAWAEQAANGC